MSAIDTKPRHHRWHPMKLLSIFLIWTLSLYIALVIIKNYETDFSSNSTETLRPSLEKTDNICKSPECITLAHHLHNWQDISVDPCQDFYQAACGKYNEHSLTPEGRLVERTYIFRQIVTEHLDKNLPTTSKSESAMKILYQKCQEAKQLNITETRMERMREMYQLIQKVGKWPMADESWKESDFDLNGESSFSGFDVSATLNASTLEENQKQLISEMMSNISALGITDLGFFQFKPIGQFLITEVKFFPGFKSVYPDFQNEATLFEKEYFQANGILINENISASDVSQLKQLLESLAQVNRSSDGLILFSELQEQVPSVDFERIIKNYMNPTRKESMWGNTVVKIVADRSEYLFNQTNNLETILRTTPKRALANFLIFNLVLSEMSRILREEKSGKTQECGVGAIGVFPLAALRVFVRNHFDKENLEMVSEMVDDIRNSFIETVHESSWLHQTTKFNAIRKLEKMKKIIGYPKEYEVSGALDSSFETLDLSLNDSYYSIQNKIRRFKMEQTMDFIASISSMESNSEFLQANAFYMPSKNSLKDSAEYDRRAQCLVDQYNNYDDPHFGKNLNGSTTILEMASDIIGIHTSWKTYKKIDLTHEPRIIGFEDYHMDKLFFRLSALNWCGGRDETPLEEKLTQSHPTDSFRVNGIFSNMKSFAEAYNCPVGSPMNPVKKCELF